MILFFKKFMQNFLCKIFLFLSNSYLRCGPGRNELVNDGFSGVSSENSKSSGHHVTEPLSTLRGRLVVAGGVLGGRSSKKNNFFIKIYSGGRGELFQFEKKL